MLTREEVDVAPQIDVGFRRQAGCGGRDSSASALETERAHLVFYDFTGERTRSTSTSYRLFIEHAAGRGESHTSYISEVERSRAKQMDHALTSHLTPMWNMRV